MTQSEVKQLILDSLARQGFSLQCDKTALALPSLVDKAQIRQYHDYACRQKVLGQRDFILRNKDALSDWFADGEEIDIGKFSPEIIQISANSQYSNLFRIATLLWSVPISQGFGRRLRFLVIDKSNGKLVGLFALGDPVFNLRIRDSLIGWNHHQRAERLYNLMDIFILGAVPPYSELLCGKLIAMMAASNEIRNMVRKKYLNSKTIIRDQHKRPDLVLLTTTSALGRSSLYNRLTFAGNKLYHHIGTTDGWGHFHLGNGTFQIMIDYLKQIDHPIVTMNRFGQGPNWKMRTIRTCLAELGLSTSFLKHGIKREVYAIPLAKNYREFLLQKTDNPQYEDFGLKDLVAYFKERWFEPRSKRTPRFRSISRDETLARILRCVNDTNLEE